MFFLWITTVSTHQQTIQVSALCNRVYVHKALSIHWDNEPEVLQNFCYLQQVQKKCKQKNNSSL